MNWSDISFTPRTLRQFSALWIVFFGSLGVWFGLARGQTMLGAGLVILATTLGPLGLAWPAVIKPAYTAWIVLRDRDAHRRHLPANGQGRARAIALRERNLLASQAHAEGCTTLSATVLRPAHPLDSESQATRRPLPADACHLWAASLRPPCTAASVPRWNLWGASPASDAVDP
jgi:hypothetical protein